MKIIGSYVSPYVRKVLACLALKDLVYEIDPITPFFGGDEFERLSPARPAPWRNTAAAAATGIGCVAPLDTT